MKRFEYRLVILKRMRDEMRASDPSFMNLDEMVIMQKVLDRIGEEGWDIKVIEHGDVVLQREIS